ncbi:DUF2490 domain-containing protein [Hymenobacter elongatus]|nr:DUF2490 domain-containing protein [Hymenobacter elongatus]
MLFSDTRLNNRWGWHAEAQWRQAKGVDATGQNILRVGVNYHVSPALQLTGGYAYALPFPTGDNLSTVRMPEHRTYQQVQLTDSQERLHVQHRYRLEQRWVRFGPQQSFTYLNRVRYQLRLAMPLFAPRIKPGVSYLVAADELFIGFGANAGRTIFDQNRAYAALGYQATKSLAVEVGYLNQLVQKRAATTTKTTHALQLGFAYSPDFRPIPTIAAAATQ